MEIEKLIEGEVYYVEESRFFMIGLVTISNNGNNEYFNIDGVKTPKLLRGNATRIGSNRNFVINGIWAYKDSNRTYRLATAEERHWLNVSIKANKFVERDEAMKSFVPEYFEAVESSAGYTIGKVYKTIHGSTSQWYRSIDDNDEENGWGDTRFKPSTKEAYDAQFPVKVEKLPRFKVIKNIGQLPSIVENDEGNEFRIGDVVTTLEGVNKGRETTITSFRYNNACNNICAITGIHRSNGVGIDKIEHFIAKDNFVLPEQWCIRVEGNDANNKEIFSWRKQLWYGSGYIDCNKWWTNKISVNYTEITLEQFKKYVLKEQPIVTPVVEETLLEKANRLYPIGTIYINTTGDYETSQGNVVNYKDGSNDIMLCSGEGTGLIYDNGQWAQIIK